MRSPFPLFLLLVFFCSCEKPGPIFTLDYANYTTEDPIPSDFRIWPGETFLYYHWPYSNNPTEADSVLVPGLWVYTTKDYSSIRHPIVVDEFQFDNEWIIRFDTVLEIGSARAVGPARSFLEIPKNTEKITFINGKEIDQYNCILSSESISIAPIDTSFTILENDFIELSPG